MWAYSNTFIKKKKVRLCNPEPQWKFTINLHIWRIHCSAVSKLWVSYDFAISKNYRTHDFFLNHASGNFHASGNYRTLPDAWFFHASGKIEKTLNLSFFLFLGPFYKTNEHRFISEVGRNCVHAVPLNFVRNPCGFRQFRGTLCTQFLPNETCASFDYWCTK